MKNLYLILIAFFFILLPFLRCLFHPITSLQTIQWIPFIELNRTTLRIYFINLLLYLIPGILYFKYCYIRKNLYFKQPSHFLAFILFFTICLLTKIILYYLKLGVFDTSTIIVQLFSIMLGYLIAKILHVFTTKL